MRLSCLHTHTNYCDGSRGIKAMCQAAQDRGLSILGFSSHAPLPFSTTWNMEAARLGDYLAEVRAAREQWSGGMEIYVGLEIDYIEGLCGPADGRFGSLGLDYAIGSAHFLRRSPEHPLFAVDGPVEELERAWREDYGCDGDALAADFWRAVLGLIQAGGFDILAHLDLLKKHNRGGRFFNPDGKAWRDGALAAIEAAAARDLIVEVNTGAMNRGVLDELYPADWMLRELRAHNVRMTINADAHAPEHLGGYYEKARQQLVSAGYTQIWNLSGGAWKAEAL